MSPGLPCVKSEPMSPRHPGLEPGVSGQLRSHAGSNHLSPASLNAGEIEINDRISLILMLVSQGDSLSVPSPAPHCVSPGPPPEIHIHQVTQMDTSYEGAMGPLHKRQRISENWSS